MRDVHDSGFTYFEKQTPEITEEEKNQQINELEAEGPVNASDIFGFNVKDEDSNLDWKGTAEAFEEKMENLNSIMDGKRTAPETIHKAADMLDRGYDSEGALRYAKTAIDIPVPEAVKEADMRELRDLMDKGDFLSIEEGVRINEITQKYGLDPKNHEAVSKAIDDLGK